MTNWVLDLVDGRNRRSFDELQAICNGFCIERVVPSIRRYPRIRLALDSFISHQATSAAVAVVSFEAIFSAENLLQKLKSLRIREFPRIKEFEQEGEPFPETQEVKPSEV